MCLGLSASVPLLLLPLSVPLLLLLLLLLLLVPAVGAVSFLVFDPLRFCADLRLADAQHVEPLRVCLGLLVEAQRAGAWVVTVGAAMGAVTISPGSVSCQ